MIRSMIFAALVMSCLLSCNRNTSNTGNTGNVVTNDQTQGQTSAGGNAGKLEDQVMALHDKTMQDLDSLMALKKDLKAVAAKSGLSKADNDSIDANLHRLQKSDDDMMDWMNGYAEPDKKMPEDKATAYLSGQLNKIQGIYTGMQRNMKQANDFLKLKK